MLEIPLTSQPEQIFQLSRPEGLHEFRIVANSRLEKWNLSIYRLENGVRVPLITGIGLMGGVNIVQQYPSLPWKELYVLNLDEKEDPTLEDLGTVNRLIELEEIDVAPVS
jgi:hypothetical protein